MYHTLAVMSADFVEYKIRVGCENLNFSCVFLQVIQKDHPPDCRNDSSGSCRITLLLCQLVWQCMLWSCATEKRGISERDCRSALEFWGSGESAAESVSSCKKARSTIVKLLSWRIFSILRVKADALRYFGCAVRKWLHGFK